MGSSREIEAKDACFCGSPAYPHTHPRIADNSYFEPAYLKGQDPHPDAPPEPVEPEPPPELPPDEPQEPDDAPDLGRPGRPPGLHSKKK